MNVAEKPLGGTVIVGDFSIGALDQKTLRRMSDEVKLLLFLYYCQVLELL